MGKKKDRMIAALEHGTPLDAVPLWELHFHMWNQYSDGTFLSGPEYMKLSSAEKDRALRNDARIILEVADELGFAGVTIPDSPWDCIYTLPPEDRLTLAKYLYAESPDFLITAGCGGVMAMPDSNYMEFCYQLMDDPDAVEERCRKMLANGIDSLNRYSACGIQAAYAAADMADNKGQFFNDAQMERFILPYLSRWVEGAKKAGIYPILHTDGNISKLLERLTATGICAVQAVDPVAGMDIRVVKEQMGTRLCLCGNIDCGELILATPEKLYADTKELLMDCKPNGCFVLGASNAVVNTTPKENYSAVIRAWRDFGKYPAEGGKHEQQ